MNGLTISFWEWLVGGPVFVVIDVSDLLALPVLFLAWRLWRGQLGSREKQVNRRSLVWDWRVWVVSGTVVFATTATTCIEFHYIFRVFELDDSIYAIARYYNHPPSDFARYEASSNQWVELEELPEMAVERAAETVELPLTKCVPQDPAICYRIEGDERILISNDGGESWETAWNVPLGRRSYMSRIGLGPCTDPIDIGPYDLFISGEGVNHRVIVASGNQGIVLRHPDGSWERQAVLSAYPTPFRNTQFSYILSKTFFELASLLFFIFINVIGHYLVFLRRTKLLIVPGILVGVGFFLFSRTVYYYILIYLYLIYFLGAVLVFLFVLRALYVALGDRRKIEDPELSDKAITIWLKIFIGMPVIGMAIMYFWIVGIIPFYWLMLALLVGASLWIARWGIRKNFMLLEKSQKVVGTAGKMEGISENELDGF